MNIKIRSLLRIKCLLNDAYFGERIPVLKLFFNIQFERSQARCVPLSGSGGGRTQGGGIVGTSCTSPTKPTTATHHGPR